MKKDSFAAILSVERLLKISPRSIWEISDRLRRKKISDFLLRRGFSFKAISAILKEI